MRIILVLLLAGCAGTWEKPGATQADWERDMFECQRDTASIEDPIYMASVRDRCMRVKGWTLH